MSLSEAKSVLFPCGKFEGKPMGEVTPFQLRWLSNRVTRPTNTKEFRHAVKAARIVYASIKKKKGEKKGQKLRTLTDAKRAEVECISCGKRCFIWRRVLDRRAGAHCPDCGGRQIEIEMFDMQPPT